MFRKKFALSFALAATATSVMAIDHSYQALVKNGLRVDGSIPHGIVLANNQIKIIRLMNISLSPNVAQSISGRLKAILNAPTQLSDLREEKLPAAKNIGMNGEAVLDQGQWGTCATFATTAAINALFPLSGDAQISQLCNLQLSRSLSQDDDQGAWDGSFGYLVLNQINQYGFINKQYQHTVGCGGLKIYPTDDQDNGSAMSVTDFSANSSMSFIPKDWTPIIPNNGTFSPIDSAQAAIALKSVKTAINQGYRIVFGTLIDGSLGGVGAMGQYDNIAGDTWVMTAQIPSDIADGNNIEGHEIIIEGYDDNACATYTDGTTSDKQCGLLRIRNSWSAQAGDQGDYYMSYDYFKGMVIEAYAIGQDVKDHFKPSTK
ncbi:MAG: hypothetical protein A3E82_09730 [Gammaproteobacteria bacterium RIFCSPHIGHO2_12_FULL_38_11]|nr:MAG: hypothetical protein A3E82_09730 [Gammaproteobacteria bacterium RIFCSPHIGHO2_12_FULL_38_11]